MEMIISVMANDRPGIAERLAREVAEQGGNWLESRMATMAGKFAGIVRIEIPDGHANQAQSALQALREEGLSIQIELGTTDSNEDSRHQLSVVGNDRPGIVREVTQALAGLGVNVIDLQTEIEPASMSGGVLFRARVAFTLSTQQSMDDVVAALEGLSPDLMVDA